MPELIDDHHRVGNRFEKSTQALFAAAQRVFDAHLQVDVERDAGQAERHTGALDDGAQAQPMRFAAAADAELNDQNVVGRNAIGDGLGHLQQGVQPRRRPASVEPRQGDRVEPK